MNVNLHVSIAELLAFVLLIVYLAVGFIIWREWRYTFPEMKSSTSKWKWIWLPAYKVGEFFVHVLFWPVMGIIGILMFVVIGVTIFVAERFRMKQRGG